MGLFDKKRLVDDLLEEREEILEILSQMPAFTAQSNWHLSEHHILHQCLVEIGEDLLELGYHWDGTPDAYSDSDGAVTT